MFPQQVHQYLRAFFTENNCPILNEHDYYMIVQLTVDMDKKIMNRPYYWHYLESTDGEPNPAQLTLITDQNKIEEAIRGEIVHLGSPRLHQLFEVTRELGSYVQLFEVVQSVSSSSTLTPWLGINYKVSYFCDRTKEMLYSFGLNLMTATLIEDFQEMLKGKNFVSEMPEDIFCLPYIIKPIRGLERLNALIEEIILKDDHSWEEEAKKRWKMDQELLEHFYEELEDKPNSYEIEKKSLEEQYQSKIKIEIINGGLFYLQ